MLVIVGLLVMGTVRAQQLIGNARVRDFIAQQDAVERAILAFQDRFRALPGDYAKASTTIDCGTVPCLNGNGNGRVDPGTDGAIHEDILAWRHISAAGFLREHFQMVDPSTSIPSGDNTPSTVFGGYLHIAFDHNWGYSGNRSERHNLKTGNYDPPRCWQKSIVRSMMDCLGRAVFSSPAMRVLELRPRSEGLKLAVQTPTRPPPLGWSVGDSITAGRPRCCAEAGWYTDP